MADSTAEQGTAPSTGRRRRWPRRVLLALGVLLLLVVLAPLAVGLPFVRDMVAEQASDAIGRPVTIEGASAFWFKGIDLEGIRVASPDGFEEDLATVKRVHVDFDVFTLLGGGFDADVRLESPLVTFLRNREGRSNTDGLFGEAQDDASPGARAPADEPTTDAEGEAPRIRLAIVDGVVRARPSPTAEYETVQNVDLRVDLSGDAGLSLALEALAVGAAAGGGDAPFTVELSVSGDGHGPVHATVPPVDLSRLAAIVEGATGCTGLTGTFRLEAEAELAGNAVSGKVLGELNGFVLRTPGNLRFAAQRVDATLAMDDEENGAGGRVRVMIDHVEVLDDSGPEPRRFREPLVEVQARGRFDESSETLVVESGRINAGKAITVEVSKPWEIRGGEEPRANGELILRADLGRLANLKALVPALAEIRRGAISARIVAEAQGGLDVKAGIGVNGLELAPGDLSPEGYTEPHLVVQAQITRAEGEGDVPLHVIVHRITSSFLNLGPAQGASPLEITIAEAGIGASGATAATLDLAPLGRAFGGALGLARGDRLGGTVSLRADANMTASEGRTAIRIVGQGVTLPTRWAEGVPPATLDGQIGIAAEPERLRVTVPTLAAFGLEVKADMTLAQGDDGGLESADVRITGDLQRARGLLAPFLGLERGDRLAGRLDATTTLVQETASKRLRGTIVATGLVLGDAAGTTLVNEPKIEVKHDLLLADADGHTTIDQLHMVSQALEARLEGSTTQVGEDTSLDATLTLGGDAARLAGVLRRVLGEDYQDLKGSGRLDGRIRLQGSTAQGGSALMANGNVQAGAWSTGGLSVSNTVLALTRSSTATPQQVTFDAALNRGTVDVDLGFTPSEGDTPWTFQATVRRVDTAPLAVGQGAGEYLVYLLPTLVPADATTQVLSGLLDADVQLAAQSTEQPKLDLTLAGRGLVKMDQGAIGESTLFESMGGGSGLGDVGKILTRTVPEVGRVLTALQSSLTFSHVESQFNIANRVVHVTKGLLHGDSTHIDFQGTVGFNESVDLKMDLTLLGDPGKQLAKVMPTQKGTIPLTVRGSLSSPNVQPNLDPASLAAGALGGLIPKPGDNPKDALDRLKDLIPR